MARFSQTVLRDSNPVELMNLACKTAIVGVTAHLIFPDEVQTLPVDERTKAGMPDGRLGDRRMLPAIDGWPTRCSA